MKKQAKTEILSCRVTPEQRKIIEEKMAQEDTENTNNVVENENETENKTETEE